MDSFDQDWAPSRRKLVTHLGTFVMGGLVGIFLEPLKRTVMGILLLTPLGRQPDLIIAYANIQDFDGQGYQVQIGNRGEETAEDVGINIKFNEKIIDTTTLNAPNMPPPPEVDIETAGGSAEINIDRLRRQFEGEQIPLFIHFKVEDDSASHANPGLPADGGMSVSYRYSWTYSGVQFYQADTNIITEEEQAAQLEDSSLVQ